MSSSSTKESSMDLGGSTRRKVTAATPKAGSVWESRMKLDEFKGGIKVFNNQNSDQNNITLNNSMKPKQQTPPIGISGKRKTWKSEVSPVQISKSRSELSKKLDESVVNVSIDAAQIKKWRSVNVGTAIITDQLSDTNEKKDSIHNHEDDNITQDLKKSEPSDDKDLEKSVSPVLIKTNLLENVTKIETPQLNDEGDQQKEKEIEVEKKTPQVKEISVEEQRLNKTVQSSPIVKKKAPPTVSRAKIHPNPTKNEPIPAADHFHGIPRTHSKLQSFVDLIMWKDVSKSSFIFGIGTFFIVSSSYTKDLNISFISVISYLGLVYLAAIFLFRSLITRGSNDMDQEYVVGEDEAIWVIKLILPYLNEFLLKLRALFSGDPATTMKLAVILFILARCGSSITIWKMAKLGFFGVFTVPKICCSYSSQLTAYGTFWIRRFGDAWESCSHKKAVGFALFTLVWNFSSVVARIWAVFMLFVAFKYYQHSLIRDGWTQPEAGTNDHKETAGPNKQGGRRSTLTEIRKQKKSS